ncbi:MAG: hypothetical protein ACO1PZ_14970 [Gammaproteobacteria bacterium]
MARTRKLTPLSSAFRFALAPAFMLLLGTAAGPLTAQDLGATPIVWVNGTNVTINGNTVADACNGCSNAAAESQQTLTSGDGYVEFVAGSGVFAVGIGSGPLGTSLDSIEYGLYFNGAGSVEVRENGGVYVIDAGYQPGDRFRISLQGGVISYHKYEGSNLAVNYSSQSQAAVQYPAKVEAVLLGAGSSVQQAVVRAGANALTSAPAPAPAAPAADTGSAVNLTWTNVSNVTVNGNTLTGTTDGQSAGAQSNETLTGDGYVEFTAVETDKMRAIGLDSQNDSDNTFQDIDFAIVLRQAASPGATAVAEIRENGEYISDIPYAAGDRFRIAVENGVVKYYKTTNGQPQQIPARDTAVATYPLHVDAALYDQNSTLAEVTGRRVN